MKRLILFCFTALAALCCRAQFPFEIVDTMQRKYVYAKDLSKGCPIRQYPDDKAPRMIIDETKVHFFDVAMAMQAEAASWSTDSLPADGMIYDDEFRGHCIPFETANGYYHIPYIGVHESDGWVKAEDCVVKDIEYTYLSLGNSGFSGYLIVNYEDANYILEIYTGDDDCMDDGTSIYNIVAARIGRLTDDGKLAVMMYEYWFKDPLPTIREDVFGTQVVLGKAKYAKILDFIKTVCSNPSNKMEKPYIQALIDVEGRIVSAYVIGYYPII